MLAVLAVAAAALAVQAARSTYRDWSVYPLAVAVAVAVRTTPLNVLAVRVGQGD